MHNPYLAAPLSIEAYRMAAPSSDHYRQAVAWLDRRQSSVRPPPVRSGPAKNPFQFNAHAGDSEESDDEIGQQRQHVQPRHGSLGLDNSANALVEPDIDAYADDAVPIGLLANLAINTPKDYPADFAEKKGKGGENAGDDDVVCSHLCCLHRRLTGKENVTNKTFTFFHRESLVGSFSSPAHHGISLCESL